MEGERELARPRRVTHVDAEPRALVVTGGQSIFERPVERRKAALESGGIALTTKRKSRFPGFRVPRATPGEDPARGVAAA